MRKNSRKGSSTLSKRAAKALDIISSEGIVIACEKYGLDYFEVRLDYNRERNAHRLGRGAAATFRHYATSRILLQAAKGSPSHWKELERRDSFEALCFADIYAGFMHVQEKRGDKGFIPVSHEQVTFFSEFVSF